MKVVVNTTWGTFKVSAETAAKLGMKSVYDSISRYDPRLVEIVEKFPEVEPNLTVLDIPEEATDWEISEYDGKEHVICVVDGLIKHICAHKKKFDK